MLMERQARKQLVRETVEKHLNELRNELVELGLKGWFNFGYESEEEKFSIGCDYNLETKNPHQN